MCVNRDLSVRKRHTGLIALGVTAVYHKKTLTDRIDWIKDNSIAPIRYFVELSVSNATVLILGVHGNLSRRKIIREKIREQLMPAAIISKRCACPFKTFPNTQFTCESLEFINFVHEKNTILHFFKISEHLSCYLYFLTY